MRHPHAARYLLTLAGIIGIQLWAQGTSGRGLPTWKSDPAWKAKLGSLVAVNRNYAIRPPKGYQPYPPPAGSGTQGLGWTTAPRQDMTRPAFLLSYITMPPGEKMPTPEQAVNAYLDSIRQRRSTWRQTPAQRGKVNGLTFARAYWQGATPGNEFQMRGFGYAFEDRDTVYLIGGQDVEAYCKSSLKLAEAAALTFQRR